MAHDFNIDMKDAFLRKLEKSAVKYPIEGAGSAKVYGVRAGPA